MRDPSRIAPFCDTLREYWEKYLPDWRFGQLMSVFLGFAYIETNKTDIFYLEDDKMKELLDRYFAKTSDSLSHNSEVP